MEEDDTENDERSSPSESTATNSSETAFKARLKQFTYSSGIGSATTMSSRRVTRSKAESTEQDAVPKAEQSTSPVKLSTPAKDQKSVSKKRSSDDIDGSSWRSPIPKKKRSSAKERSVNDPYNPTNNLVDSLRPNLVLVFCGLNPGLTTALTGKLLRDFDETAHLTETGHAYAHASNRFWHLLEASGVTPIKHKPSETRDLNDLYSIGNTNICERATRDGSGLSKEELLEGAGILEGKMREFKPEAVVIVGKQIWETIWKAKTGKGLPKSNFKWGWQDEEMWLGRTVSDKGEVIWPGARTFVTTSTSGLSANLSPAEKLAIWKPLGDWFTARRKELISAGDERAGNGPPHV